MKRQRRSSKELKEVQVLKQENRKLRRQIGKLRKVIARIDVEQYQFLKDLLESQAQEDTEHIKKAEQQRIEDKWKCHEHGCDGGVLRFIPVTRQDGTFYFRKCDNCGKRTKLKKFTDGVDSSGGV